jgi:hypothetical protein
VRLEGISKCGKTNIVMQSYEAKSLTADKMMKNIPVSPFYVVSSQYKDYFI